MSVQHNFSKPELQQQFAVAITEGRCLLLDQMSNAEPYLLVYLINKVNELESRLKELEE